MLERTLQENPLYIEYEPLLAQLGLTIVEIAQANRREGVNVVIIILAREGETTVDQCADVYRLVFPRMQLALGERERHKRKAWSSARYSLRRKTKRQNA